MAALDLLLPTYRWDSYVRGYISYLDSIISDSDLDLRLHIGDNSCNSEKHEFLRALTSPNVVLHLHDANIGLYPNFLHLVEHSQGELVLTLGDDDWIHPSVFSHATFLDQNPQCSACSGFLAAFPPRGKAGMTCFDDRFMGPASVERAIDYVRYSLWEHDVNWLALGTHRRSSLSTYVEFTKTHPFHLYFRDQMLSQIALLAGPVKGLRQGFTLYKNRDSEELPIHLANIARSVENIGLAPWLYIFYYHYWLACEYATLYLYRGIPDKQFSDRIADADSIFLELFARFRVAYDQQPNKYEAHFRDVGILSPMHDVLDDPTAIVGLRSLTAIFLATNPQAGERFANFVRREMVVEIGK